MLETIEIYGTLVYYLVRESQTTADLIYGEDPTSIFRQAYPIEMYINNPGGFGGNDVMSKFGLQTPETMSLIVGRRRFEKFVIGPDPVSITINGEPVTKVNGHRPREGDLIYIPVMQKLFEIKYVEEDYHFHTLGRGTQFPYVYELECELFKYSNEDISTGIEDIDFVERENAFTLEFQLSSSANASYIISESVYQGAAWNSATATAEVSDWSFPDRKLKLMNIKGNISNTSNIIGRTSGASYAITYFDPLEDASLYPQSDNSQLEYEGNLTIQNTETNPFGYA